MVKGDLNYLVHEFYYVDDGDEERHAHDKYEECILIFENEKEHQKFRTYVEKNWNKKNEFANDIRIPYMDQLPGYNMNVFQEEYSICRFFEECWKRLEKNSEKVFQLVQIFRKKNRYGKLYELAHVIMYNQDKYFYCANVVLMYNFTEIRRKIK